MSEYIKQLKLPFAQILLLKPNIAEIIVAEGVEVTSDMVFEYQELLINEIPGPIGLLINKRNNYTYTFGAQMELGLSKEIKATAILAEREPTVLVMRSIKGLPEHSQWNMDVFYDRGLAINWLEEQLNESRF